MPVVRLLVGRHLVNSKVIDILIQRLSDFKSYDNVLVDCYNFLGATFNFELVNNFLLTIRVCVQYLSTACYTMYILIALSLSLCV
jgi:hypothetical protein